ncbi:MAG TPA: GNAT family N-acetyltransferase [Gemmatimonadaceae bacterium]|nr:GNAT family N-acetyltransferase [Gemmatimonadaceae bacterium]
MTIRNIEAGDEARWRELWNAYCAYYETDVPEPITRHTWSRLIDPSSPIHAIVAETPANGVVGFANYVIHESTWQSTAVCYLEDLFVDPNQRNAGVGRQLIDWLLADVVEQNWSRLYWHTKESNDRARRLYDTYTRHSGFVRYVIESAK